MSSPAVSIAIPTLHGGPLLFACLTSLEQQEERDFEVVVIDNSGMGQLEIPSCAFHVRVLRTRENLGFAKAVNQAWGTAAGSYVAALNDDTEVHAGWLKALRRGMESAPDVGMCASQVRLYGTGRLDSAGMQIFEDGSSKQRGHSRPASEFSQEEDVLFASASAALYRRAMINDIGMFDEDFFLYCEDTDLGLRARRNGWRCRYIPDAVVQHHYSRSSSAASPLKAWYIERNRLWVCAKNFPLGMVIAAPFWSLIRYIYHALFLVRGHGMAAQFNREGSGALALVWIVIRAHLSLLTNARMLIGKRKVIQARASLTDHEFALLLKRHVISAREIASL